MSLARAELARYDFDAMECGCMRSAGHLRDLLEEIVERRDPAAIRSLDGHVFAQSILMQPAPAVCAVFMAMLADGVEPDRIKDVLWLILWSVAGEDDGESGQRIYERCFEAVRDGTWLVYREFLASGSMVTARSAYEILSIVEEDSDRLESYRSRVESFLGQRLM